jgi:predicted ATPase with chaperone activity
LRRIQKNISLSSFPQSSLGVQPIRLHSKKYYESVTFTKTVLDIASIGEEKRVIMSTTFAETAKAISENPAVVAQLQTVTTPEARQEILKAAGIPIPTHADVNAHMATLDDVSGASGGKTTAQIAAGVPAAVAASASS